MSQEFKAELQQARQLLNSLRSAVCPACGQPKMRHDTLCWKDYLSLSGGTRKALYQRFGEGYEEAFEDAMDELSVARIHWPPITERRANK